MPLEQTMWVEKYRPRKLEELVNQESIKERLRQLLGKKNELPHLLFAGPPGSGKTTTALIIAKELLGEAWNDYTLSLNASVAPDTPVLVRIGGKTRLVDFQWLAEKYFGDDSTKYAYPTDLEVLSLDRVSLQPEFRPVANVSRHRAQSIAEIEFSGGSVSTTLDHSVMVLNDEGEIEEKAVSHLSEGDLLVTFRDEIASNSTEIPAPEFRTGMGRGIPVDPDIGVPLEKIPLNEESSWPLGSYLAEGCVSLPEGGGGVTVLTYRYPEESAHVDRAVAYFQAAMGLHTHSHTIVSGSSGRTSGVQLTVCSKKLARFLANHFYSESAPKHLAKFKRVPDFIFDAPPKLRREFLKGYMGDASGYWQEIVRYASKSKGCLVGASWLGRLTGLHTSVFERECRVTWNLPRFSYFVGELMVAAPFIQFFERLGKRVGFNWRYKMRHQLYSKKCKTVSKALVANLLERVNVASLSLLEMTSLARLKRLMSSTLYTAVVTSIKVKPYDGYVYDLSVPGSETFWGGTTPVLLHNSDERGIDMVRDRVKTFARYADRREGVPFRLVILDESDEMCLHPDTRVQLGKLDDLREMTLNELYEMYSDRPFDLPSFSSNGMRLENDRGRIILSGSAELYKITFEDGRSVTASADHPFFVVHGTAVTSIKTKDIGPGVELADFSDKILRCYNCSGPFFRQYQFNHSLRHFCSSVCRNAFFRSISLGRRKAQLASVEHWEETCFRSKIVAKMARLLEEWRIPYERERFVFVDSAGRKYPFTIDFLIGNKTALLVNGCWWHVCPTCRVKPLHEKQRRNMAKDYERVAELERLGHKVVTVWEHELKNIDTIHENVLPRIFETLGVAGGAPPKVTHSKVRSVERAGFAPVLNISVVRNRNFVLANGILTHNTSDAQTALRRIMEESSKFTRFILVCNYSSGIIEPLQSRTAIFRFLRLDETSVTSYLKEIAKKEKLKLESESVLPLIYESTNGDLRQAINLLQAAAASGEVTADRVKGITGSAVRGRVAEIMRLALKGEFDEARVKMIELTRVYGIPERDFLKYANEELGNAKSDDMTGAIRILAEYDYRLVQGAQPELQLTAMLAELSALKKGKS